MFRLLLLITIMQSMALADDSKAVLKIDISYAEVGELVPGQIVEVTANISHDHGSTSHAKNIVLQIALPWFMKLDGALSLPQGISAGKDIGYGNTQFQIDGIAIGSGISLEISMSLNTTSAQLESGGHYLVAHLFLSYQSQFDHGLPSATTEFIQRGFTIPFIIPGCSAALGMTNGDIKFYQLEASSSIVALGPSEARFGQDAWCSAVEDAHQYIQVSLAKTAKLTAISTWGRKAKDSWVKFYYLQYSMDGQQWVEYSENGYPKKFLGNSDRLTESKYWFLNRFVANHVRISPSEWSVGVCLRFELYGCFTTEQQNCIDPIGMETGRIPSDSLSTNTTDPMSIAENARLNKIIPDYPFGWLASPSSMDWLQVDLGSTHKISKIAVQGGFGDDISLFYVTTFKIAHSNNSIDWFTIKDGNNDKMFEGSVDSYDALSPKVISLSKNVIARYIKVIPDAFVGLKVMRFELYGCLAEDRLESAGSPVTIQRRNVLLDKRRNSFYVCIYRQDRDDASCMVTRDGRKWEALDSLIISVIATSSVSYRIYAIDRGLSVRFQNDTSPYWVSISFEEWQRLQLSDRLEYGKGLDDILPGIEPAGSHTWVDNTGTEWGVSGRGVHVKRDTAHKWTLSATWKCCGE